MRAVILRSFLVIGTGGIVLAGVLYLASTVDARPPEVLEVGLTQPLPDDADVALITTSIEISFSEPVDLDDAEAAIGISPAVDGSLSASGSTLIFTPSQPLDLEMAYTLTIGRGIRDLAGNEMTELPEPYEFETTGRPALAGSEPADGAEEVPVDTVIGLVFSGLMDTVAVEEALELSPVFAHDLRWSGVRLEIVPAEPLDPGTAYEVEIAGSATDVAGVAIAAPVSLTFRTVEVGLSVEDVIPADESGGISPRTQIAVAFDQGIDPESITSDALTITPDVAGTLDVVGAPESPDEGRFLVFTPSGQLPPNTTFEVALAAGIATPDGARLAEPVGWRFTTGAPQATLSNRILFLSDRSGVANVWAMNPDGTGQHQVSSELQPVLDYAAAPDGSSLVVGDGRRLVFLSADGSERRVLTDTGHVEFDATYAPDASSVVFARADAATGRLLGLWEWDVEGGTAEEVELPDGADDPPTAPHTGGVSVAKRAPRFSPDGEALAWVDAAGAVAVLELEDERLTTVELPGVSALAWAADGTGVLATVGGAQATATIEAPVSPLADSEPGTVVRVDRRDGAVTEPLDGELVALVTNGAGKLAWIDGDGRAWLASSLTGRPTSPEVLAGAAISEVAFGPVDDVLLAVIGSEGTNRRIERVDLSRDERTVLAPDGWEVRWLP